MGVRSHRSRAGFSLVSVMVAVVILVVGLLALARAQTALAASQGTAAVRNRAVDLARAYMEQVRARPPATLAAEGATRVDSLGLPAADGTYTRTLLVEQQATNLLQVRVRVDYPRARTPVEIATLIFR